MIKIIGLIFLAATVILAAGCKGGSSGSANSGSLLASEDIHTGSGTQFASTGGGSSSGDSAGSSGSSLASLTGDSSSGDGSSSGSSASGSDSGSQNSTITTIPTFHNPEPASMVLLVIGLGGLGVARLFKKSKKA